jgi:hypothetical protein
MKLFAGKIFFFILLNVFVIQTFSFNPNSRWNVNELNTAINSTFLTDFEKEVIFEINKLRSNPAKYASDYIEPLKNGYDGKKFYYPGDKALMTKEGVKALIECVRVLKKLNPSPILSPSRGLSLAANDHVRDQSQTGATGHKGHDRSGFRNRIERFGEWSISIAENITYGNVTARQAVIYLLIDDGIMSRGHRKNFMNKNFNTIGVATGTHPYYEKMCVMEFAGKFQNSISK